MVSALSLLTVRGCRSRARAHVSIAMCFSASAVASRASSRAFAARASSARFRRINISVLSSTMECAHLQCFGRIDHLLVAPALNQHPVQKPLGPRRTHGLTSQPVRPQLGPPGSKSFRRDLLTDEGGVKRTWRPGTPPVRSHCPHTARARAWAWACVFLVPSTESVVDMLTPRWIAPCQGRRN
jgi:hypothetical protein